MNFVQCPSYENACGTENDVSQAIVASVTPWCISSAVTQSINNGQTITLNMSVRLIFMHWFPVLSGAGFSYKKSMIF